MEIFQTGSFCVMGKLGSSDDGAGFVQKLWQDANGHFTEISSLALNFDGYRIWGAMSDFSMSFLPWQDNFSRGFYLAGVQCRVDAVPPEGWTKWTLPAFEAVKLPNSSPDAFRNGIAMLESNSTPLIYAVQELSEGGRDYLLFPTKRL